MRSRVHSSPTNPLAVAPFSRACSTWASWTSDRGRSVLGCAAHPAHLPASGRATRLRPGGRRRAGGRPRLGGHRWQTARRRAAGGPAAGHVLVVPRGGGQGLPWPYPARPGRSSSNSVLRPLNPTPKTLLGPRPPRATGGSGCRVPGRGARRARPVLTGGHRRPVSAPESESRDPWWAEMRLDLTIFRHRVVQRSGSCHADPNGPLVGGRWSH
jgi:hypothetical protein